MIISKKKNSPITSYFKGAGTVVAKLSILLPL
jgi:hypothetical protein